MSGEDLRTGLQHVPGDGEGAAGDGEVDGDRVAPALEADGRRVDGHVAALADDLQLLIRHILRAHPGRGPLRAYGTQHMLPT